MDTILIFEPDSGLAQELARWLQEGGFRALLADSRESVQKTLREKRIMALVLSEHPGFDADVLLCTLDGSRVPTIILGIDKSSAATRSALNGGADCYMSKPYSPREVLARVRSLTRRVTKR